MKLAQRAFLSELRKQQWADPNGPYRTMERINKSGPKRTGRRVCNGYVYLYLPDHPGARGDGYIKRSRLIAEAAIGRHLEPSEHVHHINGVRDDDRYPENLVVLSRAEHNHVHKAKAEGQSLVGRWDTRGGACRRCGRSDRAHRARGLCGACYEWHHRNGVPI